jgi:hypothetical protein
LTTTKTQQNRGHGAGVRDQHAEVDAHAHGDEKQPEQQALERLDVGLQLAPVLAVGQQHTGQEGPQRHRQAQPLHQHRDAHHQQQRGRGEDLRRFAEGDPAQRRAQQQAAAQDDPAHNPYDFDSFPGPVDAGKGRIRA